MSKPWRITRGDQQFTVKDIAELKLMAAQSRIRVGDLIQRPDSSDWFYASELSELKGLVKAKSADLEDIDYKPGRGRGASALRAVILLLGVAILGVGFAALYWMFNNAPDPAAQQIFGDHPGALGPLEALATEHATLLSEPDSRSAPKGEMLQDSRVSLIRKLGGFYEIQLADGATGWVGTTQVIPGYKFSQSDHDKYDPLFNPDRYLRLGNYAWTPRGDPKEPETLTDMMFEIANPTDYGMQGVILKLTFMDGTDNVIDEKNFEVPRLIPPNDALFLEGIEIDIAWNEDTRAQVDIYGARALLPAEYSRLKAEEEQRLKEEAAAAEEG
jgi:hypothetical protein